MSELIQLEKRGHTAIITINNPPANTWTKASLKALEETIEALNADRNIFALVVTGQGESFSLPVPTSRPSPMATLVTPVSWRRRLVRHSMPWFASAACPSPP